jgi:hypothetical protein
MSVDAGGRPGPTADQLLAHVRAITDRDNTKLFAGRSADPS